MNYAPIVIPTLNRYDHLRECVESLKNNALAEQTELYISVDYPPSQKYVEGYHKVLEYVNQGIDGFKEVHIFIQEENKGSSKNSKFLYGEVYKRFDTYIFTEDDNVFSPDFLLYINQCLEKYKEDKEILAICGYSYPIDWKEDEDVIIKNNCLFPAWGYATWKEKDEAFLSLTKSDIQTFMKSFKNVRKLYKRNKHLFVQAVHIAKNNHYLALDQNKELKHIDCVEGIYLVLQNMYVLMPALSMVRNMGSDGSGINCANIEQSSKNKVNSKEYYFSSQPIDERDTFSLEDKKIITINKRQAKKLDHYMKKSFNELLKSWMIWILYYFGIIKIS